MRNSIFILTAVILLLIIPATACTSLPALDKGADIREEAEQAIKDINTEIRPYKQQDVGHEEKIQHIRSVFSSINSRSDFQVIVFDTSTDFIDSGILVKAVFVNDVSDLSIPLVECYYEDNLLIFAYAKDGENEYRYYFENGNLIREIGANDVIVDYPDGDGFQKTSDSKAKQIYVQGQLETVLFAENFKGTN